MLVIRKANGGEFLKVHLQACLERPWQTFSQLGNEACQHGLLHFVSFRVFRG